MNTHRFMFTPIFWQAFRFPPPAWGRWFAERSGANRRGESARKRATAPTGALARATSPTLGEENNAPRSSS
jgi:hypothetical protein